VRLSGRTELVRTSEIRASLVSEPPIRVYGGLPTRKLVSTSLRARPGTQGRVAFERASRRPLHQGTARDYLHPTARIGPAGDYRVEPES